MSDKIEAMMNTKDVIKRWEFERTLNRELMSDEEKARWKVRTKHNHPSILKMFGLVIACVGATVLLFFVFLLLVIHSASTMWAQWLWFTAAILGFIFVDAYAVKCLSGEDGDIIHSYFRGFFRSTSRQASNEDEDEIENGDEENPAEEEVVASPVHSNDNSSNKINTTTAAPTNQVTELTEVNQPSRPQNQHKHHKHKRPSMIRTPSSKPSVPVSTLTKKYESPKTAAL